MCNFPTLALAWLLAGAIGGLQPGVADAACMSSRDPQAVRLLQQRAVLPFPTALSRAGISNNQVATVQLCSSGGGYVYRVRLRQGPPKDIPAN